jgi:hypothetical protein
VPVNGTFYKLDRKSSRRALLSLDPGIQIEEPIVNPASNSSVADLHCSDL